MNKFYKGFIYKSESGYPLVVVFFTDKTGTKRVEFFGDVPSSIKSARNCGFDTSRYNSVSKVCIGLENSGCVYQKRLQLSVGSEYNRDIFKTIVSQLSNKKSVEKADNAVNNYRMSQFLQVLVCDDTRFFISTNDKSHPLYFDKPFHFSKEEVYYIVNKFDFEIQKIAIMNSEDSYNEDCDIYITVSNSQDLDKILILQNQRNEKPSQRL